MVVGVFPVAKLGVLALKQVSKPIANLLKARAKNSLFFRQNICAPPAQFYNWCEVKMKMWSMNLSVLNVPKLNEAIAVELGANLLGELVIFTIGAGLLLLEYQRQVRKEEAKEQVVLQEKLELNASMNELFFQVERQDTQIRELNRVIAELDSRSWTPKVLNDLVRKKKHEVDERLQLLPEKKSSPVSQQKLQNSAIETGNEPILLQALTLIDDVFYSKNSKWNGKMNHNIVYKSLDYLFVDKFSR